MSLDTSQLMCCGVLEVSNVQSTCSEGGPEAVIAGVGGVTHPFVIMTGIVYKDDDRSVGEVAAYIAAHRLGEVTVTPTAGRNPNSDNLLKVWVWRVNKVALRKWRAAHQSPVRKAARRAAGGY